MLRFRPDVLSDGRNDLIKESFRIFPPGDDEFSVLFGWLDKAVVHRQDRSHIMVDGGCQRLAALANVPLQPSPKPHVRRSFNENLDLKEIAKRFIDEQHGSF